MKRFIVITALVLAAVVAPPAAVSRAATQPVFNERQVSVARKLAQNVMQRALGPRYIVLTVASGLDPARGGYLRIAVVSSFSRRRDVALLGPKAPRGMAEWIVFYGKDGHAHATARLVKGLPNSPLVLHSA